MQHLQLPTLAVYTAAVCSKGLYLAAIKVLVGLPTDEVSLDTVEVSIGASLRHGNVVIAVQLTARV